MWWRSREGNVMADLEQEQLEKQLNELQEEIKQLKTEALEKERKAQEHLEELEWIESKNDPGVKQMRTDEHGDDWIAFSSGAWMIETRLRYSAGRAEATLRGLCAGGEVRSLRTKFRVFSRSSG
jgi:hypothetical protein